MKKTKRVLLNFLLAMLLVSCNKRVDLESKMDAIRKTGDFYPDSALVLLHEIKEDAEKGDEHTKYSFELLNIRLQDKAYRIPSSDKEIKEVLEYFERYGSWYEKQEANYYAGSVYRDLDDVPRALVYFMKSVECTEKGAFIDSVMLRNSYSQMYALFFSVQDYRNALRMAKKEVEIARKLNILDASTLLHECSVLLRVDSLTAAKDCIMQAFLYMKKNKDEIDIYSLSSLLYQLSRLGYTEESNICYSYILDWKRRHKLPVPAYLSLGKYYLERGSLDSAICSYDTILQLSTDLNLLYDATRNLALIYHSKKDSENASLYAHKFILINDSLNLEKRQIEAATTYNKYKYQKDNEEEQRIKAENNQYYRNLILSIFSFVTIILIMIVLFSYHKNKQLKEIVRMSIELNKVKMDKKQLQGEIIQQEHNLAREREKLNKNEDEKEQIRADLSRAENELFTATQQLQERMLQSKSIIQLLYQTKFEEGTDNIIEKIKKAAEGMYKMSEHDWKMFHNAVNSLYPDFSDRIVKYCGNKINVSIRRNTHCHIATYIL